ncbi:Hsp33 family molecular chaperone HslO [Liquorilactobacillus capillatus]|uniref:33 kDa chaperonin n=1 Tax=Liquorilactobacillus capillatus DSM 19910 TaxID=1423731 RepID=A0A0R1M1I5_9LACO|nr:Hsp33 family molecular chaperone HslO [Liquorilactobacillus capillatus]KRL01869.1 Hsp33-like chaperonin [Liquorilactobacillus capillatus DSM 19910]
MKDYLVKSLAYEGQIRVYAIKTEETIRKAQEIHATRSAATAAFGRAITATAMLSAASLKGQEKMTVKIMGDGPTGAIVVDGNAQGKVKGYLQNPQLHFPLKDNKQVDVREAIGSKGVLSVTKDLGLKTPFTGQVPLVSGELGEDFTYYLAESEQIPSAVGLSVVLDEQGAVDEAGGFMIQVMPQVEDEVISQIEKKLATFPSLSGLMVEKTTPEEIIFELCGKANVQILDKLSIAYQCDCSKARFARSLASIAPRDLETMIQEDHGAEATCRFCGQKYHFTEKELKKLAVSIK